MLPFRDYNPSRSFPLITVSIVVLNVLIFLYMVYMNVESGDTALQHFIYRYSVVPAAFLPAVRLPMPNLQPAVLTLFSAMFLHGGWLHLLGNMLYLWIFGNNVEDIMGSARFLAFYLLCGVIATVTYLASVAYVAHTFHNATILFVPSLGASGAIAGVLGAYLVRFPKAQVDTCIFFFIITVIRLPAILVLAFWFVLQFVNGISWVSNSKAAMGGGVAVWAHIGGFLAGMLLINLFARRDSDVSRDYDSK